ncbi:uncharacterized protein [Aristolochia californica]|uniref:uncharacterized protein isoform X2 n=1 Tax=Aristolochia californica TaxID=171875 RepID=UPI0035D78538
MEYNSPKAKVSSSARENLFTLRVGQVFTGFCIGCGIGIGVGRPLNFGTIPALREIMAATRGATDAFSGVGRHLNGSLGRLGLKSIEAGLGCGVGLYVKPGVVHRIQSFFLQAAAKMMTSVRVPSGSGIVQGYLQSSVGKLCDSASKNLQNQLESSMSSILKATESTALGSRSEKVIHSFLKNPVLKNEEKMEVEKLLLKHQKMIEELMEENKNLRRVLVEDLKVPPSKLQSSKVEKNSR